MVKSTTMTHCFPLPEWPVLAAFLFLLHEPEASFKDCSVWATSFTASFHDELLSSCQRNRPFSAFPHQNSIVTTITKPFGPARCSTAHASLVSVVGGVYRARGMPCGVWRNSGCIAFHHLTNAIPNSAESAMRGGSWYGRSPPRVFVTPPQDVMRRPGALPVMH